MPDVSRSPVSPASQCLENVYTHILSRDTTFLLIYVLIYNLVHIVSHEKQCRTATSSGCCPNDGNFAVVAHMWNLISIHFLVMKSLHEHFMQDMCFLNLSPRSENIAWVHTIVRAIISTVSPHQPNAPSLACPVGVRKRSLAASSCDRTFCWYNDLLSSKDTVVTLEW